MMAIRSDLGEDLANVLRLNDHIGQVQAAHIPLQLDTTTEVTPEQLEQLNSRLALQASRGSNLQDALGEQSPEYRTTLEAYKLSGGQLTSLELLHQRGLQHQFELRTWRYACGHLIALYLLAGLVFFLWLQFSSVLQTIYETSKLTPGPALQWLNFFKANYSITFVVYLTLFFIILAMPQLVVRLGSLLPNSNRKQSVFGFNFAIARFLRSYFERQARMSSNEYQFNTSLQMDSDLLAWARHQSTSPQGKEASSASYQAIEELMKSRIVAIQHSHDISYSMLGRILPGALVVLFLGVILFWPIVELLITICLP